MVLCPLLAATAQMTALFIIISQPFLASMPLPPTRAHGNVEMVVNLFPYLIYSMTEIGRHGVDVLEQFKKAPQRSLK